MGMHTQFSLDGWKENNSPIENSTKDRILDKIEETGAEILCDYGSLGCDAVANFTDESFSALDNVTEILTEFSKENPDTMFQLAYDCDDTNDHLLIRFKNGKSETREGKMTYPAFSEEFATDTDCE